MPRIVIVHGIGQQLEGEDTLLKVWVPAMRSGMRRAQISTLPDDSDVACAFYGDLYRPPGTLKATGLPLWTAADVDDDCERELLKAWWREAAERESAVPKPDAQTKAPGWVQSALNALLGYSPFFAGLTERMLIGNLKQVRSYFRTDLDKRQQARDRIANVISSDTRVVVAHSLGSVVAYEVLCHPCADWSVQTFVTLGSPLGIPNLIFDRLDPPPMNKKGTWPTGVKHWYNIADKGDIVALVKNLNPLFGGEGHQVQDLQVHNERVTAHDISPYLTSKETGHAIGTGFDD